MFATLQIDVKQAQIAYADRRIQELQAELQEVRENKAQLEYEKTALETLQTLGEGAIAQAAQFMNAALAANQSEVIEAFRAAMTEVLSQESSVPELEESAEAPSVSTEQLSEEDELPQDDHDQLDEYVEEAMDRVPLEAFTRTQLTQARKDLAFTVAIARGLIDAEAKKKDYTKAELIELVLESQSSAIEFPPDGEEAA